MKCCECHLVCREKIIILSETVSTNEGDIRDSGNEIYCSYRCMYLHLAESIHEEIPELIYNIKITRY